MAIVIDTTRERPRHPEKAGRPDTPLLRKPEWLRVRAPGSPGYNETRAGSVGSRGSGRPVVTLQKAQARVQISPMIIMVA